MATLLGGMGCNLNKNYCSNIGYIYGTGTNVSYIEKNVNITKVGGLDRKGCMVINTECGGFDKFPRGEFDEHVNATSVNPGEQSAEKMTSGKYLAEVIFCALEKAKEEGLIDVDLTDHNLFSTANISEFLHQHGENCALSSVIGAKDMEFVTELSLYLIDERQKSEAIMNRRSSTMR